MPHAFLRIFVLLSSSVVVSVSSGDMLQNPTIIPYTQIPHFPHSTAIGHKGNLIAGTLSGVPVLCMQGRFHYYEGYPMEQVTFPVRVMKLLGSRTS